MKRVGLWTAFRVAITVVVLVYLFNMVEFARMAAAMRSANPVLISVALSLAPLNIVWLFLRWKCLLGYLCPVRKVPNKQIFGSILSGTTLRVATPGGLGEHARILYIRDISRSQLLALSIIDNLVAFAITVCAGSVGLAYTTGIAWFNLLPILTVVVIIAFFGLRRRISLSGLKILPQKFRFSEFGDVVRNIPVSKIMLVTLMAAAMYIGYTFQFYLLIRAFEPISIGSAAAAISSTMLVKSSLPISFGDLGIRETASIFFLGKFGISDAAAINASLLLFSFNLLVPAAFGTVFIAGFKLGTAKSEGQ